MPQASEELRAEITLKFGSIDAAPVHKHLTDVGWTIDNNWKFYHPKFPNVGAIPGDQWECILFLIHEWDYSPEGLEQPNREKE